MIKVKQCVDSTKSFINKYQETLIDVSMIILFSITVFLYFYDWLTLPGILHPETVLDMENFLNGGIGGIKDFISKTFNLNMIEGTYYRPRWLGFAVQYVDIHLWKVLNQYFHIGGHFLLVAISAIFLVFAGAFCIKQVLPTTRKTICLFSGGAVLVKLFLRKLFVSANRKNYVCKCSLTFYRNVFLYEA